MLHRVKAYGCGVSAKGLRAARQPEAGTGWPREPRLVVLQDRGEGCGQPWPGLASLARFFSRKPCCGTGEFLYLERE